jgi:hypothetical protein
MKSISFITVSKNDNYDPDNIDKIVLSIKNNAINLINRGVDVETILVDWGSDIPLYTEEKIKNIEIPVKHILVDKSLIAYDGLNPDIFYEYFAKNVGIRNATKDYVMIVNCDTLNSEELSDSIVKFLSYGIDKVYARPTIRINGLYPDFNEYTHYDWIWDKPYGDLNPGDFILFKRSDLIDIVQGYDESNTIHRSQKSAQTHMDVEILVQSNIKGIHIFFLNGYITHMHHDKSSRQYDSARNMNGYENRTNWGYCNITPKLILNNVYKLEI